MYYEEKMIDGVMNFRNHPDGTWHRMSIGEVSYALYQSRQDVRDLRAKVKEFGEVDV